MPVAPIFQPELPAKAIRFRASHLRRNFWVGFSTACTILGERLAPKLVDRYLGRPGVSGQQTQSETPRWEPNVFSASDEDTDRGSHGPFDASAHASDPQLWASMHRRSILAGLGAGTALAVRKAPR
jgi:hypothetical protein